MDIFDITTIRDNRLFLAAVIGKRACGKTTLMQHIAEYRNDIRIYDDFANNWPNINVPAIFSVQCPIGIPPRIRNNLTHLFIFRDNIKMDILRLYDKFISDIISLDEFRRIMHELYDANDYSCIVVDLVNRRIYSYRV